MPVRFKFKSNYDLTPYYPIKSMFFIIFLKVSWDTSGNMQKIDRSAQRRHGLDASAFNSSMCFGDFLLERPCRIAVPIDRAERLVGFRCIRLHRHQVVSVVGFDDAAGGISDCVQRVYRDNPSGN